MSLCHLHDVRDSDIGMLISRLLQINIVISYLGAQNLKVNLRGGGYYYDMSLLF